MALAKFLNIIALLFVFPQVPAATVPFRALVDTYTFNQATEACGNLNGSWKLPTNSSVEIGTYLKTGKLDTAWLGITKKPTDWRWVNGEKGPRRLQPFRWQPSTANQCGVLSLQKSKYQFIGSMPCTGSNTKTGFVCQIENCVSCPSGLFPQNCFTLDNSCFIVGCAVSDWYAARQYCQGISGDLAVVGNKLTKTNIIYYMRNIFHYGTDNVNLGTFGKVGGLASKCDWVFIGLILQNWAPQTDNRRLPEEKWIYSDNTKYNCAVMKLQNKDLIWQSVNCSEKYPAICENNVYKESAQSNCRNGTIPPDYNGKFTPALNRILLLSAIIVIVFLLVIILVLIFCLVVRAKGKETFEFDKESGFCCVPVSRSSDLSDLKLGLSQVSHASVVLLGKPCENQGEINVQNSRSLPRETFASDIYDCLKWALEILCKNEKHNKVVEDIRVITVPCLNVSGLLTAETAEKVICFLEQNTELIQIVLLPPIDKGTFGAVTKSKLINLTVRLRQLSRKMVFLTPSKNCLNIFLNECIVLDISAKGKPTAFGDFTLKVIGNGDTEIALVIGFIVALYNGGFLTDGQVEESCWNTAYVRQLLCHIVTSDSELKDRINPAIVENVWDVHLLKQNSDHIQKRVRRLIKARTRKADRVLPFARTNSNTLGKIKVKVAFVGNGIVFDQIRGESQNPCWSFASNKIRNMGDPDNECQAGTTTSEFNFFLKSFSDSCGDDINKMDFEIINIAACRPDYVSTALKQLDEVGDLFLVHMETPVSNPPKDHPVYQATKELSHKYILISAAQMTKECEIAYPNNYAISVGKLSDSVARDQESVTSALLAEDNISGEDESIFGSYIDFQTESLDIDDPGANKSLAASYYFAGIVTAVYVKAVKLGVPDESLKKLQQTHVMHRVLKEFSTSKSHDVSNGWGLLDLSGLVTQDQKLVDAVRYHTNPKKAPRNYWNGRNIVEDSANIK